MNEKLNTAIQAICEKFEAEDLSFRDEHSVVVSPEDVVEISRLLRDKFDFEMLSSLTAVDYWPESDPRFHVVYQFYSVKENITLRVRAIVPGENPTIPSIEGVYPNANWHERELWDMFGIHIEGHSDLRRILMPYEWEGHPLRKDYPLGYEEVQFTFNVDEIDKKKPYVSE